METNPKHLTLTQDDSSLPDMDTHGRVKHVCPKCQEEWFKEDWPLRDRFAAEALNAIISNSTTIKISPEEASRVAYLVADAMLIARNNPQDLATSI